MDDINKLYMAILDRTYPRDRGLSRFRRIMGAILVQQSPLCIGDLAGLLDLRNPTRGESVDIIHFVRRLRTILVTDRNSRDPPKKYLRHRVDFL
jgi:hypothetical protein